MSDDFVTQARALLPRAIGVVIAALVLATAAMAAGGKHPAPFVAVDLGTIGGDFSEASAVSSEGIVVGRSSVDDSVARHAFMWSQVTGMIDLGTLKDDKGEDGNQSFATAVSDDGVIAGVGYLPNGTSFHAFVRTPANGVVDLGTLGGFASQPTAMNSKGAVVGFSYVRELVNNEFRDDVFFHAFLWTERDGMVDLGTLGGKFSFAHAINDDGVVVGDAISQDGLPHAFKWTQETGKMIDLGTLGGSNSSAQAINDKGVVAGNSDTDPLNGDFHAFIWTRHRGLTDIGVPRLKRDGLEQDRQSFAEKINDHFVIGQTFQRGDFEHAHGFAWTRGTGLVDIGTLGGDLGSHAAAVNDDGLVVGGSWTTGNAAFRAFAWSLSSGMMPLESPGGGGGRSEATAINGDLIVGSSCTAGNSGCHATLWKPSSRSRRH
jgi:probable HAF family extracellular repeat protein